MASIQDRTPVSQDTVFRIGSISKRPSPRSRSCSCGNRERST